jgi:uncharacterized protein YbcV (DUF1398 family)
LGPIWPSAHVRYDVDFDKRIVTYYGSGGDEYAEEYPAIELR